MKLTKTINILYALFVANYVFSESQLVEYAAVNILLVFIRYVLVFSLLLCFVKKQRRIPKNKAVLFGVLSLSILINTALFDGGLGLINIGIVVASLHAYERNPYTLIKINIKTIWISSLIVVILCFIGLLEDRTGIRYVGANIISFYDGSNYRHTYGFLVPNQLPLALYITYILVIIYKQGKLKIFEHLIFFLMNIVFLFLCGSRVSFIMTFLLIIAYFIARNVSDRRSARRKKRKLCIMWLSYPIGFCLSLLASLKYNPSVYSWLRLNNILMNRLLMSKTALNSYGISLFGSGRKINDLTVDGLNSATVDNGYMNLLISRGIIITIIVICLWSWITYRAEQAGNFYIVFCLVALAVSNLIDAHLTSYKLIPLFVLMLDQYSLLLVQNPSKTRLFFLSSGIKGIEQL